MDLTLKPAERVREAGVPLPTVLFEDEHLIAFDKPSGLLVAPDRWDKQRVNLMGLVHDKLGRTVANVHRLDADTSGVLLCARNKPALDFLSGQFQSKTAAKEYVAMAAVLPVERAMKLGEVIRTEDGRLPGEFAVSLGLGPDERNPGRMRIVRGRAGKASETRFQVIEDFGKVVFLKCEPLTGRTHQIRLHLAAAGAPVLNDPFYGDPSIVLRLSDWKRGYKGRDEERPLISRLALHAAVLTVAHPVTREPVRISAPMPREFEVALKSLRKYARFGRAGR